jgi:hypothetical protein
MYSNFYFFQILMTLETSRQFFYNTQIPNFMKMRPAGVVLFHAHERTDRQTDRKADVKKLTVAFLNFANAPNK